MAQEIERWITVNGVHIPIMHGQSKEQAIKSHFAKQANSDIDKREKQMAQSKAEANVLNKPAEMTFDSFIKKEVGLNSYMLSEEHNRLYAEADAAYKEYKKYSDEWRALDKQLSSELLEFRDSVDVDYVNEHFSETVKDIFNGDAEDMVDLIKWSSPDDLELMGLMPKHLTELSEKVSTIRDKYITAEKAYKNINEKRDAISSKERKIQLAEFKEQRLPLKDAKQENYRGFKIGIRDESLSDMQAHNKDLSIRVVEMSPKEYLQRCAFEIFHRPTTTFENTVAAVDFKSAMKYADMMRSGTQFDTPYLDYDRSQQEGRHRAVAAIINGYDKIPVLIINKKKK